MEKIDDLVSIIIPFYNGEKYINKCMNSILNQEYKNIEIIFINDGSTDNSINKLKEYNDERIKIYSQERLGVSAARNFGVKKANGKFIAFMDIDDELDKKFVKKFIETAYREKVDVVICNYNEIYSDGSKKEILLPWKNIKIDKKTIKEELIPQMISTNENEVGIRGLVWRTFVKKKLIEDNNLRFIEGIQIAEDLLFVIQLYNKVDQIYVLENCLYNYYKNGESTLNKYLDNMIESNINFYNNFVDVLKKENLYNDNKERYLKNKLQKYTIEISNAVRSPDIKETYKQIKIIRRNYLNDNENYNLNCIAKEKKLALILLKCKLITTLIIIFKIKEYIRRRKFS